MRIYENGIYRDMTSQEIEEANEKTSEADRDYWVNTPYDIAVNREIRKRYTDSQEFAIIRQKDEKPEEYQAYYDFCESCKTYVKNMIDQYK